MINPSAMSVKSIYPFSRAVVSLLQFNILLALWMSSAVNIHFYRAIRALTSFQGLTADGFVLVTGVVIFAYYLLVLQLLSWRFNAKWLATLLIVISAMGNYFVAELGIAINQEQIMNMLQTDLHEALDLVSWRAMELTLLTIVVPLIFIWRLSVSTAPLRQTLLHKLVASLLALVVVLGLVFTYYAQYAPMFREHRDLKQQLNPHNSLSGLMSYAKHSLHLSAKPLLAFGRDAHLTTPPASAPRILVLVVGETARAESFGLNGYARPTNPELSQLDVINFSKVSSCGTETAVSVPCMFSGMPRKNYDESLASHREGLLDIAQRAGYQVTWIDNNSGCKRTCDRVARFALPLALQQAWCDNGECHDELLVASLDAYLKQLANQPHPRNQLIVLHQIGSHGPAYYKRYPARFNQFKPACDTNAIQNCSHASLINSYDNTVLYTDHILASIIGQLQQQKGYQTAMWYLSDHGESTGEHGLYLHGAPYVIAPSQQTHIPMLMWFSQQWQQQAPQLLPCLKAQQAKPRSQDNLFPSLLSILDIKTQVINPQLDLLSLCRA